MSKMRPGPPLAPFRSVAFFATRCSPRCSCSSRGSRMSYVVELRPLPSPNAVAKGVCIERDL
eukprot:4225232-Pyramimonas_sp.AAC.1